MNTNQPRHEDLIQLGGFWTPTTNFMLSSWIGIEQRRNRSVEAEFDEDNYPIVFNAWYAPTCRLSFSGGLAFYSNWIDQDITFGNLHGSEPTRHPAGRIHGPGPRHQRRRELCLQRSPDLHGRL